jgi:hypothetical protein
MVKRRLVKDGKAADDFELGARAWGERIEGTPFVTHKGKVYLEVIYLKPGTTEYFLDGQPINKSDIEGLEDKTPSEEGQGGVNDKVIIRTYALASVTALRVASTVYN